MLTFATPLLLVAMLGAEDAPKSKFPLGKDTTYFTGPLDKDGYIDYQAALNDHLAKGITPESNANALLWKALGPAPEGGKMPAEFFKRLGIEEPPPVGDYLVSLQSYLKDTVKLDPSEFQGIYDQQTRAMQRPWKKEDFPHIAAWLAANEKPLALAFEATRRPDYYNPMVTPRTDDEPGSLIAALLPSVQKSREIARALSARAMLRVGEGKFKDAWQDLLACHRLGRLVARGATLIEALVGIAIDGIASNADLAYLEHGAAMLEKECLKDLQALPAMPPMADKIDLGERVFFLDSVQLMRRGKLTSEDLAAGAPPKKPSPAQLKALALVDWEPALRNGNRWFDNMAAAMRVADRTERQKGLAKLEDDLKALGAKRKGLVDVKDFSKLLLGKTSPGKMAGEAIGDVLLMLLLPATKAARGAEDRCQQVQRNLHLAFALAAYRRDHERYPEALDDLAPKYLAAVPNDIFSGNAIIYLPVEKGYFLYSVGVNGKDEEGRWYDDEPPGDDPRVRMPLPELKVKK